VSPLHFAVKVKAPRCVEVLLEFGADIKMKLRTPENKSLPYTALQLAEGERDVAIKNKRENDIAIYDDIIQLIKDRQEGLQQGSQEKKKKKKKKNEKEIQQQQQQQEQLFPDQNGTKDSTLASLNLATSASVGYLDKLGPGNSGSGAGSDLGTSSNNLHSVSMPVIPPTPSSALDMHKITLKAAQNQTAIKKLEEKNEQLQREIEGLRQDIDLIKKLVVSLDLSQKQKEILNVEVDDTNKRKPVAKSSTDKGPSTKSGKESKKKASGNASPKKNEEDDEEFEERESKKLSSSNAGGGNSNKKDKVISPRDERTTARRDTAPTSSSKGKKSKKS